MKYYKLTDANDRTNGETQWGENVTHKAQGVGRKLCTSDVIHVYDHPLKAVMFNPIHANFKDYHLWEVKVKKIVANDTLKVGVKQCTTIRRIDAPIITIEQGVRAAILISKEVCKDKKWNTWADNWLSGRNRTESAAWSAAKSAEWAGLAARSAESATWSAARSAESAAWSAARSAEWSTMSAGSAESAARSAARAAQSAGKAIDFVSLIKKALKT